LTSYRLAFLKDVRIRDARSRILHNHITNYDSRSLRQK
jgi:hypothetical protein